MMKKEKGMAKTTAGKEIWVWGDMRSEMLLGLSLKALAKARELACSASGKVAMVLFGSSVEKSLKRSSEETTFISVAEAAEACIAHGADFVRILDNKEFLDPQVDVYARALADTVSKYNPLLVMVALTDFGRELAARAARINHAGLIAECMDLHFEEGKVLAKCPSWGGEIMADITFSEGYGTGFLTVQAHGVHAVTDRGDPGGIDWIEVDTVGSSGGIKRISSEPEPIENQRLEEAKVVVAGGAGLGSGVDFGLVRDLAAALGGEVGATRPPVLQHWVEEERMIGQTGKTVRPELLFSIGTSGAVQYTAGIREAKNIIAVNRDKKSPIFQVADLGIVADAKTFIPLLTARIKQVTMRKLTDALYQEGGAAEKADGFGEKVRRLRKSHDLSLEALAQATGQSPEFIEKVERDEVTPSVSFLLRFASTLKVDPGTFLSREQKTQIKNMRAQAFVKRTKDYSYQTLSSGGENDHLRAFMITIEPKQSHKPVAYKHEGEEFIFVMEGDLQLTLEGKAHHLKPGESFHFNSDTPHKLKSTSTETTRCLVLLYTP
jgi:electron transfer flavoprotein alpha subunit